MPYNYHDSDVSMESQNSVIVNSGLPGQAWVASGGVEETNCVPQRAEKFKYDGEMRIHADGAAEEEVRFELLMDGESAVLTSWCKTTLMAWLCVDMTAEQLHGLKAEL